MDEEELDELEEKFKDDHDALRLVKHIRGLHEQIDRMCLTIEFLEGDIERLKGERLTVSSEDKNKIIEILDTKSYKNIAGMMDFLLNGNLKQQYIPIDGTPYLLYPNKIQLVSRTLTHDVLQITLKVGHECPHDKAYFVEDDEISIFKELSR